jgi:hypothetical protein
MSFQDASSGVGIDPQEMLAAAERYLQRSELLRDPDARLVLTGLARLVLRSAGEGVRGVGESAEGERGSAQQQPAARGAPVLGGPRLSRGFVPLRMGEAVTHVPVSGTSEEIYAARVSSEYGDEPARPARASSHSALTVDPVEVAGVIARRCAIKVEACEVAMARQADPGLGREGADALIARAKALPNCFLWMFMPGHEVPAREVLEMIRGCYENLRSSAVLMGDVLGGSVVGKRLTQRIAELAARSQSALRAALRRTWMERSDYDQDDMFLLLRRFAEQEQVFIERHMRVDDPADPALWNQTAGELTEVSVEVEAEQQKGRESRKFLNKARHHAKRILHDKESSEATDWESVQSACLGLLDAQPGSAGEVRELLGPIALWKAEAFEPEPRFADLLEEALDRADGDGEEQSGGSERPEDPRVAQVREKLAGRRVVLFGGAELAHQRERIQRAFALGELAWVTLREHASSEPLRSAIEHPETALVLGLVRLAGHQHIDDGRDYAGRAGKPYVLVPGGFSPTQLAKSITDQTTL